MVDLSEVKRQLEGLLASLHQRQSDALERKTEALKTADASSREIEIVTKALENIEQLKAFYSVAETVEALKSKQGRVESGHNRKVIVGVLSQSKRPMKASEIARLAYENGSIKSKKGYKGVYATVSTVLSRNGKHIFVNLKRKWDLRERRINAASGGATPTIQLVADLPKVSSG